MLVVVYDLGFEQSEKVAFLLKFLYAFTLIIGISSTALRYYFFKEQPGLKVMVWDSLSLFFMFLLLLAIISENATGEDLWYFNHPSWINTGLFLVFFREFSALKIDYKRTLVINPIFLLQNFFGFPELQSFEL